MDLKAHRAKYRGDVARSYEKTRANRGTWNKENEIIARWVRFGPLLDVPVGTGRYIPHYRKAGIEYHGLDVSEDMIRQAQKKDPNLTYDIGSIIDMPYGDGSFETVVCTRLFNWFDEAGMTRALSECLRVGRRVIFSVRLGEGGARSQGGTYTHSRDVVREHLAGRFLSRLELISETHRGRYEMWEVRRPTWEDVENQFKDRRDNPLATIRRLAGDWAPRMGVEVPDLGPHCDVRVEWWPHSKVKEVLHRAAEADPNMLTDKKPRRTDRPLVAFEKDGRYGLIDGRRRANLWQDTPSSCQVLVIPC